MNILLTGGTSGIGLATMEMLLDEGHSVFTGSHSLASVETAAKRLKDRLSKSPFSRVISRFDLRDAPSCYGMVQTAASVMGSIDVFIHCAGIWSDASLVNSTHSIFRKLMEVNFIGAAEITRLVMTKIVKQGGKGHLIYITGSSGGSITHPAYSASKAALLDYIESVKKASLELKKGGIDLLVSTIAPPPTDTPLWDHADSEVDRTKMAEPKDVAEMIRSIL